MHGATTFSWSGHSLSIEVSLHHRGEVMHYHFTVFRGEEDNPRKRSSAPLRPVPAGTPVVLCKVVRLCSTQRLHNSDYLWPCNRYRSLSPVALSEGDMSQNSHGPAIAAGRCLQFPYTKQICPKMNMTTLCHGAIEGHICSTVPRVRFQRRGCKFSY